MRVIIKKNINPGWNVGDQVNIEDLVWLKQLVAVEAVDLLEAMPVENEKPKPATRKRK